MPEIINGQPSAASTEEHITTDEPATALNTTHRSSDGKNHADVVTNTAGIATNVTAIGLNTTHRGSDGKNHADVVTNTAGISTNVTAIGLNTTHRGSDGSDHSIVGSNTTAIGLNTTHRGSDGSDHSKVGDNETAIGLNTTHRSSNGSDHSYLDQAVTIAGSPTHAYLSLSNSPTAGAHATNKDYVDGLFQGLDWQESVIDIVDNTAAPPAEVSGNRYLLDATGGGVHGNWDGAAVNDIVEFDGTSWFIAYDASGDEGGCCWVEDEDTNYVWNTSSWVKFGSTVTHNNTSGLQGGTSSEYYHLTSAQHTAATRDATNSVNGLMPTGKLTNWDAAYTHVGVSSGNPHSVTPTELTLVIGTNTQAHGDILDDFNTLTAPASDGQFIVATGVGAFAYESTTTARTSLGVGEGDSPQFTGTTLIGGDFRIQRQAADFSIVDTTVLGTIEFYGDDNTASADAVGAQIQAIATGTWTDGAEDAKLVLNAADNGTLNANQLVLATSGSVGIGTTSPRTLLSVTSGAENTALVNIGNMIITAPSNEPAATGGGNFTIQSNTASGISVGASISLGGRSTDADPRGDIFGAIFGGKETAASGDRHGYLGFYTSRGGVYAEKMRIDSTGQVGIGKSPNFQLELSTDSAGKPTTNTWNIVSDERIKTNIKPFTDGLDLIMDIRPITYSYNELCSFVEDGSMKVGILAQELQTIAPYMVVSHKAELDGEIVDMLDYQGHALAFIAVNAIQELQLKNNALEDTCERLDNEIRLLKE